eukprot:281358-Pyramimonas_sp.AAC.1
MPLRVAIVSQCSLPRLCLEGFSPRELQGPSSANCPGRFPRHPPRGSPSDAPLAQRCLSHLSLV